MTSDLFTNHLRNLFETGKIHRYVKSLDFFLKEVWAKTNKLVLGSQKSVPKKRKKNQNSMPDKALTKRKLTTDSVGENMTPPLKKARVACECGALRHNKKTTTCVRWLEKEAEKEKKHKKG
eukprot:Lithocolla_globosa_v1_NODE_23_length_9337_cov_35.312756.p4 type:complete len:121 gc:universal NODE_23_length_9337_cov_35.312756:4722-5084(+)